MNVVFNPLLFTKGRKAETDFIYRKSPVGFFVEEPQFDSKVRYISDWKKNAGASKIGEAAIN